MKIAPHIHRLRIDFTVTPEIRRFVHVYLIEGERLYLVDAGVAGADSAVADYVSRLGRCMTDIAGLFLTHSHPDHIGAAAAIKRLSGCQVYASPEERDWIEDVEKQFRERPIPNFHSLLNESVKIDTFLHSEEFISCEEGITLRVFGSPGHSRGSLSFLFTEDRALFTGDAVPVPGDIPIYVHAGESMQTLRKILDIEGVDHYCSAWDEEKDSVSGQQSIKSALIYLEKIDVAVRRAIWENPSADRDFLFRKTCEFLNLQSLESMPLFRKSVMANMDEAGLVS